jgi:uncharacterized protein YbdZ (MbtH family)
LLRLSAGQDSLELDSESIPIELISSVIYGPASPTLDRMRASKTLAPLVAPCDCFAISASDANGQETSFDFAALNARAARSVVIVLALLKSGRTFSGMLLWHGAQMRLRSLACGLGPQTFATGPASSVLQLRARERALAALLLKTARPQSDYADPIPLISADMDDGVDTVPLPLPGPTYGGGDCIEHSDEDCAGHSLQVAAPGVLAPIICPDAIPAGWDVLNSGGTGELYYVNTVTGTAQKEFPAESALPAGWDMVHSETTGDDYYVNIETGQTSSDLPMQAQHADNVVIDRAQAPAPAPAFQLDLSGAASPSRQKPKVLQQMMKLRAQRQERAERDQSALPPVSGIETVTVSPVVAASMTAAAAASELEEPEPEQQHGSRERPSVPTRRVPTRPPPVPSSGPSALKVPSKPPPRRPAPKPSRAPPSVPSVPLPIGAPVVEQRRSPARPPPRRAPEKPQRAPPPPPGSR